LTQQRRNACAIALLILSVAAIAVARGQRSTRPASVSCAGAGVEQLRQMQAQSAYPSDSPRSKQLPAVRTSRPSACSGPANVILTGKEPGTMYN
jgi:hypothetical protein